MRYSDFLDMRRFFIFISLLFLLMAIAMRKWHADRVLFKARKVRLAGTAYDFARKMLDELGHHEVVIEVTPRSFRDWAGADVFGKQTIRISEEMAKNQSAYAHGRAAILVGLYLLSLRDPKSMDRRRWAIRFGHVFPIFTTMVIVFAVVVAKMPLGWGIAGVLVSLALAAGAQMLTLQTERQAAELACVVIEKKRIFPRLSEEEDVLASVRAWSWNGLLPGILARFG
jgi:Zn-dependent membrane protease YugP